MLGLNPALGNSISVTLFSVFYSPASWVLLYIDTQTLKIARGNDLAIMAENLGVYMEKNRTAILCRTEWISALWSLSRQVGWEGFYGSNLILDRKHPSPYVKIENFSSKISWAWGLALVMDFLHLHFLKLFDTWPNLNKNSNILCLAKISYVCICFSYVLMYVHR